MDSFTWCYRGRLHPMCVHHDASHSSWAKRSGTSDEIDSHVSRDGVLRSTTLEPASSDPERPCEIKKFFYFNEHERDASRMSRPIRQDRTKFTMHMEGADPNALQGVNGIFTQAWYASHSGCSIKLMIPEMWRLIEKRGYVAKIVSVDTFLGWSFRRLTSIFICYL